MDWEKRVKTLQILVFSRPCGKVTSKIHNGTTTERGKAGVGSQSGPGGDLAVQPRSHKIWGTKIWK